MAISEREKSDVRKARHSFQRRRRSYLKASHLLARDFQDVDVYSLVRFGKQFWVYTSNGRKSWPPPHKAIKALPEPFCNIQTPENCQRLEKGVHGQLLRRARRPPAALTYATGKVAQTSPAHDAQPPVHTAAASPTPPSANQEQIQPAYTTPTPEDAIRLPEGLKGSLSHLESDSGGESGENTVGEDSDSDVSGAYGSDGDDDDEDEEDDRDEDESVSGSSDDESCGDSVSGPGELTSVGSRHGPYPIDALTTPSPITAAQPTTPARFVFTGIRTPSPSPGNAGLHGREVRDGRTKRGGRRGRGRPRGG